MMRKTIHTLIFALLTMGCIDEQNIEIIVPYNLYLTDVNGGDSLLYPITIYSKESILTKVDINSSNLVDGTTLIFSDTLDTQRAYVDFTYNAPKYENKDVPTILTIRASDEGGNIEMLGLAVNILGGNDPLDDMSNVKLFSAESGRENGFSFTTLEFVNSQLADPTSVDIYEYVKIAIDESVTTNPTESTTITIKRDESTSDDKDVAKETLSLEWRTMTDKRLARLNGFDYDNATYNSVVEGYLLVDKFDKIVDICSGDIILVGYDDQTPLAVLRINEICDNEGSEDDFYDISIKIISTTESNDESKI